MMSEPEESRRTSRAHGRTAALFAGFLLVANSACGPREPDDARGVESAVPLVRLLADEQAYRGSEVTTFGYLSRGLTAYHLFLTSDHAQNMDLESSIQVQIVTADCLGSYVFVTGRYDLFELPPPDIFFGNPDISPTKILVSQADGREAECRFVPVPD